VQANAIKGRGQTILASAEGYNKTALTYDLLCLQAAAIILQRQWGRSNNRVLEYCKLILHNDIYALKEHLVQVLRERHLSLLLRPVS